MDALGLPMSFGKRQVNQPEPAAGSSEPAAARGDVSGRGSRGVVGGGKRNRGRGRGGSVHATGSNSSPIPTEAFNVGVKRPHSSAAAQTPSLPFRPPPQQLEASTIRGGFGQRGRGGPRGGRGGGGGGAGSHQPSEQGFFKESFCEDPWKSLMEQRERRRAVN